jgi:hypothetical protein
MEHTAKLLNASHARVFALAGNATLTLVSVKTGTRFTYRIREAGDEHNRVWFVNMLNGPDNEADYKYLGRVDGRLHLHIGRKSPRPYDISPDAKGAQAFTWFWNRMMSDQSFEGLIEVWHEGRCARCARKLTVPSSIESGFGPECVKFSCS